MALRSLTVTLSLLLATACAHDRARAGEASGEPIATVPYAPTSEEVVAAMLDLAAVGAQDVVYDLGSGDGRIVIAAAKAHGARGVGIEIDPGLVAKAQQAAAEAGVAERATFRQADLFKADFRDATVVTLYIGSRMNLLLRGKLVGELRPGTRIVSNNFDMGDWTPEQVANVGWNTLYLWTVPEQVPEALRTYSDVEWERVKDLPY